MNRIETRIIIMVTNRLAAAKDSDAKAEMIEELSENLYQRYLELVEGGMAEDEALRQAFDSLGDVDELLAFLKETEEEAEAARVWSKPQEDVAKEPGREAYDGAEPECEANSGTEPGRETYDGAAQEQERFAGGGGQDAGSAYEEKSSSFSREDLENGIEEIVNAAISATKVAVDCARDVAKDMSGQFKDMSDQFKERYPDGVFTQFSGQKTRNAECMVIPAEDVSSLDIRLTNGDIELSYTDGPDIEIEIEGDTQDIKTMLRDNGVLSVTQGSTASAVFLFMRGIRRTNVMLLLPQKAWESVCISTTNGDIRSEEELSCTELKISATSGDLELARATCENMELKLCSGDIDACDLKGNLYAESKSGDIEVCGSLGRCEMFSASGDVEFAGVCAEITGSSTSGDVELRLEQLPKKGKGSSISGDCEIIVPADQGFHLSYRTVSGSFSTDIPLAGRLEKKCGDVVYGESAQGELILSSVSGDIHVGVQD